MVRIRTGLAWNKRVREDDDGDLRDLSHDCWRGQARRIDRRFMGMRSLTSYQERHLLWRGLRRPAGNSRMLNS